MERPMSHHQWPATEYAIGSFIQATVTEVSNGIAFYQEQIASEEIKVINEAMVEHYQQQCLQQ
jgi:hypothetical protein